VLTGRMGVGVRVLNTCNVSIYLRDGRSCILWMWVGGQREGKESLQTPG